MLRRWSAHPERSSEVTPKPKPLPEADFINPALPSPHRHLLSNFVECPLSLTGSGRGARGPGTVRMNPTVSSAEIREATGLSQKTLTRWHKGRPYPGARDRTAPVRPGQDGLLP